MPLFGRVVVLVAVAAGIASVGRAAEPPRPGGVRINDLLGGGRKPLGFLSDSVADHGSNQKPVVRAGLTPPTAKMGDMVILSVTVSLPPDTHTYSTDPGTPGATRIEITDAVGLKPKGEFEADHRPTIVMDQGKAVETFEQGVTWIRQYEVTDNLEKVRISGLVDLKYCDKSSCRPFSQKIHARLINSGTGGDKETAESDTASDGFTQIEKPTMGGQPGPASLTFTLSPRNPTAGDKVTLAVKMQLDEGWHTYSTTQNDEPGSTPTTIKLDAGKGLVPFGDAFKPNREPESTAKLEGIEPKEVYHNSVTWTRRFQFQPVAGQNGIGIKGSIHYGVCDASKCLPPKTVDFSLGDVAAAGPLPKALPDDMLPDVKPTRAVAEQGLWYYLGAAFLGGMILNVMPCVLPVLAIKVLSFVQQAGESRARIFLLNVLYSVGVLAVFLTLATLVVVFQFSWGGLFQQTRFNIAMACIVFAMGLSLLGVFEIPVPGFVGFAASSHQGEGLVGALFTGILATLLATPCTGPFMATAIGWAVGQPPAAVYLVCSVMGLGMASPYLVLGLFPQFVKWLPKPGTWMVRFKEFAGFILLGSVIFIIYYLDKKYTIPVLVMLLGISLGLWMIGNLYDVNSRIRHKMTVRVTAILLTLIICWGGYSLSNDGKYRLAWEPFSETRITALLKENKTVLVDFTAEWCLTCHYNEGAALNTRKTHEFVARHGIVPLQADFTNQSPEIKRWLSKFGYAGVPLTVIFPAGRQNEPIVLDGLYTQGTLLDSLQQAVGSPASNARTESDSISLR